MTMVIEKPAAMVQDTFQQNLIMSTVRSRWLAWFGYVVRVGKDMVLFSDPNGKHPPGRPSDGWIM